MKLSIIFNLLLLLIINNNVVRADWVQTNGPNGGSVYSLAVIGTNLFAGTASGVYLTTNDGTNWKKLIIGPTTVKVPSLAAIGTNLFAGSDSGMFLSTNNGTDWTRAGLNNIGVTCLAVSGTNLFAGTFYLGMYISTDNGTNWTPINNGLPSTLIYALAAAGTNIFAATDRGTYLSTNNGADWTQVGPNNSTRSVTINGSDIFIGTYRNGVYLSTNNGTDWTQINNGLTNYIIYALASSGTNIFAGTDGNGVFYSWNYGTNWKLVNSGLSSNNILSLIISGNNIFAGTDGLGVWRRTLYEITDVTKDLNNLPNEFSLFQNYPNPFNPSTIISYNLKQKGYVKLRVFDIKGDLVKILADGLKDAGYYETEFNSNGLASGIYFYRIEVTGTANSINYSDMKKAVLLK